MPAMPSIPSIPGLRKSGAADGSEGGEGAPDVNAAGAVSAGEEDDKSRYIRYGPLLKNDGIIYEKKLQQRREITFIKARLYFSSEFLFYFLFCLF